MKTLKNALFVSLLPCLCYGGEVHRKVGEADPLPKNGFANFDELQTWAANSSFGGGGAGKLLLGDRNVFFSDRMVTSGRSTSQLIFFLGGSDSRITEWFTIPTQLKEHKVAVENNLIVVRVYDSSDKSWPIAMTISPWMLPDSTTKKSNKPEMATPNQPPD